MRGAQSIINNQRSAIVNDFAPDKKVGCVVCTHPQPAAASVCCLIFDGMPAHGGITVVRGMGTAAVLCDATPMTVYVMTTPSACRMLVWPPWLPWRSRCRLLLTPWTLVTSRRCVMSSAHTLWAAQPLGIGSHSLWRPASTKVTMMSRAASHSCSAVAPHPLSFLIPSLQHCGPLYAGPPEAA